MKHSLFTLFFLLFTVSALFAQEGPKGVIIEKPAGTKYAILIGINDYASLNKLRYTKSDIKALQAELQKVGFEDKNVFALTCGSETKDLSTCQGGNFESPALTCGQSLRECIALLNEGD